MKKFRLEPLCSWECGNSMCIACYQFRFILDDAVHHGMTNRIRLHAGDYDTKLGICIRGDALDEIWHTFHHIANIEKCDFVSFFKMRWASWCFGICWIFDRHYPFQRQVRDGLVDASVGIVYVTIMPRLRWRRCEHIHQKCGWMREEMPKD